MLKKEVLEADGKLSRKLDILNPQTSFLRTEQSLWVDVCCASSFKVDGGIAMAALVC